MKLKIWGIGLLFAALQAHPHAEAQTYSKADTTEYHDDTSLWVLGQVERTTTDGIETSRTEYGWKASPIKTYAFGKLQQTIGYYTSDGTISHAVDGNNNLNIFRSWMRGIPRQIEFADGNSRYATVDDSGQITSVTDENGYKTCYGYDAMGRVNLITYPSETTAGVCDNSAWAPTTITFATAGNAAAYGMPAGHWRQTTLTGNGRKILIFDALWRPVVEQTLDLGNVNGTLSEIIKRYDAAGRPEFQSYPMNTNGLANYADTTLKGVWTDYDALDRVTSVTQDSELGLLTTATHYMTPNGSDGYYTAVINPRGQTTRTWFQAFDQPNYSVPRRVQHADGSYTDVNRDVFGKPTAIIRRNSNSTVSLTRSYAYNGYQEPCRSVEPESGATLMGYDGAGNPAWSATGLPASTACDPTGTTAAVVARKAARTFDARNRVKTLSFPDGKGNQSWTYTPDGLPAGITTYNGTGNTLPVVNTYSYNKRRLMTAETSGQTGWYTWGLGYGYNANGHLASQSYPDGLSVAYAPNALGQPTQAGTYATGVSYYPNGAIKQFTYGNGIAHTLTQNARQLPARSTDSGVQDMTYAYDANANPVTIRDVNAVLYAYSGNRDLQYDNLDRLTQAHLHWWQIYDFTYDVLDNITSRTKSNGSVTDLQNYFYEAGTNRLVNIKNGTGATVVGLGYDVQGNLANKNGQLHSFDYGNRLREVTGKETYRYDGWGRRIESRDSTYAEWQYSSSGQLMFSHDARKDRGTNYIYLGGSLIALRERPLSGGAFTDKYQHTDALGSPVAVTNAAGAVIERTSYEPYGAAINKPTYDGIGYTGHMMDGATGLTYMQQRYYDPGIGRFLSVDPVTANRGTGANFNRYWYANDNPYKFYDPDGRYVCTASNRVCDKIDRAAQLIARAAAKPGADPRLAKISAFLGKAGQVNGVSINDKVTKPGNAGQATREQNGVHIGMNMARLSTGDQVASVLVHEGSHGVDHMDPHISKQMNDDVSRSALNASELRGGESQAKLFKALGRQEPFKLYSPTDGINWDAINSQADRSINQLCPSAKACNP